MSSKNPRLSSWHDRLNQDPEKRRAAAVAFAVGHKHRCVNCRRPYQCAQACDPIGEGLKTSICPGCFDEARTI